MGVLRTLASPYINIVTFSGRAGRAEYWVFHLLMCLIGVGAAIWAAMLATEAQLLTMIEQSQTPVVWGASFLLFSLPSWSLLVRRLHDTGRSGWWWLILFVPLIGAVVILVFTLLPSTAGPNWYGAPPTGADRQTRAFGRSTAPATGGARTEEDRRAEVHALYLARVKQAPS